MSHVRFQDYKLLSHYVIHLTFNRQTGQCRLIRSTSVSSEREYTVLTWSFELNSVPVTAKNWHLEGHVLRVNCHLTLFLPQTRTLLARSQYPEGPGTGHLDTGFSWFPCVYKRMLRWFPSFQVATICFSCSPPDLNFLVAFFFSFFLSFFFFLPPHICVHVK